MLILYLCVFYFTRTTRESFYSHLEAWQLNVCLKATQISDLVSAANIKRTSATDVVNFLTLCVKFPLQGLFLFVCQVDVTQLINFLLNLKLNFVRHINIVNTLSVGPLTAFRQFLNSLIL